MHMHMHMHIHMRMHMRMRCACGVHVQCVCMCSVQRAACRWIAPEQIVVGLPLRLGAVPLAGREVRGPRHGLEGEGVVGRVHEGLPVRSQRLVRGSA